MVSSHRPPYAGVCDAQRRKAALPGRGLEYVGKNGECLTVWVRLGVEHACMRVAWQSDSQHCKALQDFNAPSALLQASSTRR